MNIAIDIRHLTSPNPSGIGRYTIAIIEHLAAASPQDQFTLFSSGRAHRVRNLPAFRASNISLFHAQLPNRLLSARLAFPKGSALEDYLPAKPDAWLFPNLNIIRTRLPYAITMHDVSFELYPEFFTRKMRLWHRATRPGKLLQEAQAVLAVSQQTKHDLTALFSLNERRVHVCHHGADPEFGPRMQPQDAAIRQKHGIRFPYLLCLCTAEPRKNLAGVIEAFDLWVARTRSPHHLVLAGPSGWKSRALEQTMRRSGNAERIHRIGYVPRAHTPALYRGAEAFLFPSFYEGFGLPVLEAMASGTPVITSFTGSLGEVAGDAAILVDPYNVRDIACALEQLTPDLGRVLAARGIERAKSFTWNKAAQTTLGVLRSCAT